MGNLLYIILGSMNFWKQGLQDERTTLIAKEAGFSGLSRPWWDSYTNPTMRGLGESWTMGESSIFSPKKFNKIEIVQIFWQLLERIQNLPFHLFIGS
jgi:hypothetical protein